MLGRYLKATTFSKFKFIITGTHLTHLNRNVCFSNNIARLSTKYSDVSSYSCLSGHLNYERVCSRTSTALLTFPHSLQTRSTSSQSQSDHRQVQSDTENFLELYLINNIRFYRLLSRFSKYSFITFLFGSPLCIVSSSFNIVPIEILRIIFSCLTFYIAVFMGQSFLFSSRIAAKIMISPDRELVKISHLTMFGNRKDVYLKPSDIIKFDSFGGELMSKNVVMLKFKKPVKNLIFLPGHGGIDTNYHALEMLLCSGSQEGE